MKEQIEELIDLVERRFADMQNRMQATIEDAAYYHDRHAADLQESFTECRFDCSEIKDAVASLSDSVTEGACGESKEKDED